MEQRWDMYLFRLQGVLLLDYAINPLSLPPSVPGSFTFSYPPLWLVFEILAVSTWKLLIHFPLPRDPSGLWGGWTTPQPPSFYNSPAYLDSYRNFVPEGLPILDFILKLPLIAGVLIVGLSLLRMNLPIRDIGILWLLNPFVLNFTAGFGGFDILAVLGSVLAVYFVERRPAYSAAALGFGVLAKLYPIVLLPPILLYLRQKGTLRHVGKYLLVLFAVLACGSLVYLSFASGTRTLGMLLFRRASPDIFGHNAISGLTWQHLLTGLLPPYNIPLFPLLFLPPYLLMLSWLSRRTPLDMDTLVKSLAVILLLVYLSYSVVNAQYLLWILPFLVYLTARGTIDKAFVWFFSLLPLITVYFVSTPLYYVSPALVPQEWNLPPASDFIRSYWPSTWLPEFTIFAVAGSILTLGSLWLLTRLVAPSFLGGIVLRVASFKDTIISLVPGRRKIPD